MSNLKVVSAIFRMEQGSLSLVISLGKVPDIAGISNTGNGCPEKVSRKGNGSLEVGFVL
jgi:hypothetical protein